jgi:asparagine synthase (glutamine-hydrolysing)
MGVRPLFYCRTPGAFLFASEAKAILAHPAAPRRLDAAGLDQVFTYWCTLPPRTLFEGIEELPPAHCLTYLNGKVAVKRYWNIDFVPSAQKRDENACAEELLELLTDATRIRLRADVPVGAYLSGGLDSSLVAALARRVSSSPLKTFSITFEDPEFDESAHQQEVARTLGTEHHAVRCTEDDIGRVFPEVVWHAEKPLLRSSPAPLYLLSRLVRESGHKVVLTGEGSDEILGGYDIFKEAKVRRFCAAQPGSRLRPRLLKRLYPYLPRLQAQPVALLQGFFRTSGIENPFFSHLPRWEMTSSLKGFYTEALKSEIGRKIRYADVQRQLPPGYAGWDGFSQAQYLEASMLLPGYILSSQGDRVAMAHAVEGRFPFLDHRVVEFACALPARLKMKALEEKYLLRRSARGLVPGSVCERRKQPYRAPDARNFFGRGARHYTEALLSPSRVRQYGLFEPAAVTRLLEKCRAGRAAGAKDNMALVGILSSQLFMAQYTDPARTPPTQGPAL